MKTNLLFSILAVLVIFSFCGFASAEGLVAHWKLDETSGSTAYDSANGFDGTLLNGPVWTAGKIDGALSFDGTQAVYIDGSAGHSSPLNIYNTNMTISAWIKPGLNAYTVIARAKPHYTTYRLYVTGGKVGINTYNSPVHWDLLTGEILDPNNWYHIVGVLDRDNDTGIIYVNGIEQARSTQMTTDPPSCDAPTKIGCRNYIGDYTFIGLIDDVRIYDYALDANEVQELYQPTPPCDPAAQWKFDETSGTTAYDSAGSHNGTVIGNPVWATGQIDGCLDFDGSGDYVDFGDIDQFEFGSNDFAVSFWFKTEGPHNIGGDEGAYGIVIGKYNLNAGRQWFFQQTPDGKINFATYYTHTSGESLPSTNGYQNQWVHCVGVRQGSKKYLYINGIVDVNGSCNGVLTGRTTKVLAGAIYSSSTHYYQFFNGKIDDVRVFNCALSADQVAQLYEDGAANLESIEIAGPNSVPEESDTQYQVIGYYDNGSSADITGDANITVVPDEFVVIDSNGMLETFRLYRLMETCTIWADCQGFSDSKPVTIYPLCDGNECTPLQLARRNITDVIKIKQDVMDDLKYAMKIERVTPQLLTRANSDKRCKGFNRGQLTKAQMRILSAIMWELWANSRIDASVDSLEDALKILQENPVEKPILHIK